MKPSRSLSILLSALVLPLCGGLWSGEVAGGEEAKGDGAQVNPPPAKKPDLAERLNQMERRLRNLEQALIDKDARIGELQRKLEALEFGQGQGPGQGRAQVPEQKVEPPRQPGMQFKLTPDQMKDFQRRLDEHFRDFDDLFEPPQWRGNPDDWKFKRERNRRDRNDLQGQDSQLPRRSPLGRRPRLGVSVQDASAALRDHYRNNAQHGAFITRVTPGTPADRSGLQVGDCVVRFDNIPVRTAAAFGDLIRATTEGTHTLEIIRRGEAKSVRVFLGPDESRLRGQDDARDFKQDGPWLRRKETRASPQRTPGTRHQTFVKTSALELSDELARSLALSKEGREKMASVLAKRRAALNKEYQDLVGRSEGGADSEKGSIAKPLIRKHVALAEKELEAVLSEKQLNGWRDYRERNQTLDIVTRTEMGEAGRPQVKKPAEPSSEF